MIEIVSAELSQALPPRRPVDQQRPQPLLEMTHVFADHGRRQPQLLGGGSEGAEIGDLHEDGHTRQSVHDYKPMVFL